MIAALQQALDAALDMNWDRAAIIAYAQANQWDKRVAQLLRTFDALLAAPASSEQTTPTTAKQRTTPNQRQAMMPAACRRAFDMRCGATPRYGASACVCARWPCLFSWWACCASGLF